VWIHNYSVGQCDSYLFFFAPIFNPNPADILILANKFPKFQVRWQEDNSTPLCPLAFCMSVLPQSEIPKFVHEAFVPFIEQEKEPFLSCTRITDLKIPRYSITDNFEQFFLKLKTALPFTQEIKPYLHFSQNLIFSRRKLGEAVNSVHVPEDLREVVSCVFENSEKRSAGIPNGVSNTVLHSLNIITTSYQGGGNLAYNHKLKFRRKPVPSKPTNILKYPRSTKSLNTLHRFSRKPTKPIKQCYIQLSKYFI